MDILITKIIEMNTRGGAGNVRGILSELQTNVARKKNDLASLENKIQERQICLDQLIQPSSGYGTSDVVKHSNTLEDLDDQDVFKSMVEPSSDKFNGHEIKTPAAAPIDHATVS